MMAPSRPSERRAVTRRVAGLAVALLMPDCAGDDGGQSARTYVVRATVRTLPSGEDAALTLTHEAIPDFVDRAGERVGLDAMTLPLPLTAGVDLRDVEVGDPVVVALRVDWESEQPIELTAVRRLPADVRLDFGPAPP